MQTVKQNECGAACFPKGWVISHFFGVDMIMTAGVVVFVARHRALLSSLLHEL